jgi:DNA-binding transcriptional MocR family regulator
MTTLGERGHLSAHALRGLLGEWENGRGAYSALADRLRVLIIDGRIPDHTRLPSERELAEVLGRSRTTIVSAYRALRDSGHLTSVRGSGSVATLPPSYAPPGLVDFARAVPPAVSGLDAIIAQVMATPAALDRSGYDLVGDPELRHRIAARYSARGLPTTADQVMVTIGAQHAIALVARTLIRRTDHALVETPTYPHAYEALLDAGARLVTTPVTSEGWDVDHLGDVLNRSRPALAYLIPDFHNPTGASMPPGERDRLIAHARRAGTILVIDETTADLNIDRPWDDGPFAARVTGGHPPTVTIGSLSKSIWGGLRIGWIRASTDLINRFAAARPAGDLGTPQLEQLIAAESIRLLPELLPRRAALLREHRDLLTSRLRALLPEWDVPAVSGGLSLWAGLGSPISSTLALAGQARGLVINAGSTFSSDGTHERFVRIPFTAPLDDLDRGAQILADTWHALPALPAAGQRPPTVV